MLAPDDPRHGTLTGYKNYECRCNPCREAAAVYERGRRAALRVGDPLPPDDPRHGTRHGYSAWGCRCEVCRASESAYRRTRREARGFKVRVYEAVPRGPERERDERVWNGGVGAEYGCTVTFENADGQTLVLARTGPPTVILREWCAEARAADDTFRVVAYSTPATILSDLAGMRDASARLPEWGALGVAGCLDELHPRLRGSSPIAERGWRERDALAR